MNVAARRRIAVVDDEPSLCRALRRLLQLTGFDVDTYACGEAFLSSLADHTPDCVILDLQMPRLTGFDVQARLTGAHPEIPVVIITGYDSPSARERALAGGAAAYLPKPVREDDLLAAIEGSVARPAPDPPPAPGVPPQSREGMP